MEQGEIKAVVIGASAGAVESLSAILPKLTEKFSLPIMIVVHLPPDRKSVLADLFADKCQIKVKEAEDKEELEPGVIYFAPPDYHLLVEKDMTLSLSNDEPVLYSRPSIDVLFETAADAFGSKVLGVILSGANEDGANGMRAIKREGGHLLVQDPQTAYSSMMPQAAISACPDAKVLHLKEISSYLQEVSSLCTQ